MADEETQGQEELSWWAFDAFDDSTLPSASFDEPLVWPESIAWAEADDEAVRRDLAIEVDDHVIFPSGPFVGEAAAPAPPGAAIDLDVQWQGPAGGHDADGELDAEATAHHVPLAGLGGGSGWTPPAAATAVSVPAVDSIWAQAPANDLADGPEGPRPDGADLATGLLVTTSPGTTAASPAAAVYAETDGGKGGRTRRFGARPGNAAVIALISLASLVLLGMFLSVRSRDEIPTDSSQTRSPVDEIAVTGTLNTVSLPTTSIQPPDTIDIAGLIPPSTDAPSGSTATTPATTRATTPATSGATATTAPSTATTTATTTAPTPTTTETTATTAAPDDTRVPRTTRTIVIPSIPIPSFPTIPSTTPTTRSTFVP